MSKYTEKSVVLLKRETEDLSLQVHTLLVQKEELLAEIPKIEERLSEKRRLFRGFDDSVALYFTNLHQKEHKLIGYIDSLKQDATKSAKDLRAIREGIKSIVIPKPDFSFIDQATKLLSKKLAGLVSANDIAEQEQEALQKSRNEIKTELVSLRNEKGELKKESEDLEKKIEAGNDKNGRMGQRYLVLEAKVKAIELRERDSIVMQKRLMPEYQKVYAETQNKPYALPQP